MKENEATNGSKLQALLTAMLVGNTFAYTLSKKKTQSSEDWDNLAKELCQNHLENVKK